MATLGVVAALAGFSATHAPEGDASSHREAPLIKEDPTADNTDVYAFVSTESGRQDYVTLIANYIPIEEPGQGPNYYQFSPNVLYEILVDTDGDAQANLTYTFAFRTTVANGNTFLYNTAKVGLPPNPSDPSSQYANLNVQQSYTLTEVGPAMTPPCNPGQRGCPPPAGPPTTRTLLQNARVAPVNIGPRSTGAPTEYEALAAAAVITLPNAGGMRVFAGQRDEGFYVDTGGAFDLLNLRNPGTDGLNGFNVHTIAIEVPKARFAEAGDTDGRIGVWARASRQTQRTARGNEQATGPWVQVSRLANPLINEVLIPLKAKDQFNATEPVNDATTIRDFIVNPGTSQGAAAFVPLLNSFTNCTSTSGRADLEAALLLGIPGGLVMGFDGNRETQRPNPVVADLIRLNFNIPPAATPNRLGLLGGDVAGFPNGRRVGDDVTDIALRAAGGELQPLVMLPACAAAAGLSDAVSANDLPYLNRFPYLATPHQGRSHLHDHD